MLNFVNQKTRPYLIISIFIIICLFFIINSNYTKNGKNLKIIEKDKNNLFNKIIETRNLKENNYTKNIEKICELAQIETKEYYLTGNLEKIGEIDNFLKYDAKYENQDYIQSLINFIKVLLNKKDLLENEDDNLIDINSIKSDIFIYLKHTLPATFFFVLGILIIPIWLICCSCCCCNCCNCCCCCCCKKERCKIPCAFIILILFIITISLSFFCVIKYRTLHERIAGTECSFHQFFEQALEGEAKEDYPKWIGFNHINEKINELNYYIINLRSISLYDLNEKINIINERKKNFQNKMEESGNKFYSSDSTTYANLYSNEYDIDSRGISGRYVLDIIKMFGKKVKDIDEEKYEPKNSILDSWHNEYKLISNNADIYFEETIDNLKIISEMKYELINNLENCKENMNKLSAFFTNINSKIKGDLINKTKFLDKYEETLFILYFSLLGSLYTALIFFNFSLCICGCYSQKCCFCFCKFTIHLFWNILYLIMILSFIIGSFFIFIGSFGNDIVDAISVITKEENLKNDDENPIANWLEDASQYLNIYINGNGSISTLFENDNPINSLNNLINLEKRINETKNEFEKRKNFLTYFYYIEQLNARNNLSIIPMLIKDNYEINIPLIDDLLYKISSDKFIKLDYELDLLNSIIINELNKNEQWKINSDSPNECKSGVDPFYTSSEFNPLKCRPLDRDWIQITSNNKLKLEATIISDIFKLLYNANNINNTKSFISILNDLKNEYNEYLDEYIKVLYDYEDTLNEILINLNQYNNKDIFSLMNGKIIGINLKIICKNLKTVLGKDIKTLGIFLIIIGFTSFFYISFIILLIIIINIEKINKELSFSSNHIQVNIPINLPKRPTIFQNSRQNSFDTLFKPQSKPNNYIIEAKEFFIQGCKIDPKILDDTYNCQSGWRKNSQNGPQGYLKNYYPPLGWTGIGLKVALLYKDEDNSWIKNNHNNGEWYIGYHGVPSIEAVHGICKNGFIKGPRQFYKNANNINPLTNLEFPKCGEGVYFTNEIDEAAEYAIPIEYKGNKYKIVFMCRINPYKVRIADIGNNKEYWVVEGNFIGDLNGKKRSDQVRAYRILMKKI